MAGPSSEAPAARNRTLSTDLDARQPAVAWRAARASQPTSVSGCRRRPPRPAPSPCFPMVVHGRFQPGRVAQPPPGPNRAFSVTLALYGRNFRGAFTRPPPSGWVRIAEGRWTSSPASTQVAKGLPQEEVLPGQDASRLEQRLGGIPRWGGQGHAGPVVAEGDLQVAHPAGRPAGSHRAAVPGAGAEPRPAGMMGPGLQDP